MCTNSYERQKSKIDLGFWLEFEWNGIGFGVGEGCLATEGL